MGGAPLVVKLLEGTQGVGVILAETKKAAESVIEAFRGLDANILVQEYIKEAGGTDIRCFVVGGRVVAAMKRQGAPGEFRSNLHRGGTAREGQDHARGAHAPPCGPRKTMGLNVAGVDILRSNHGPVVMEVNSLARARGHRERHRRRRRRQDHRVPREGQHPAAEDPRPCPGLSGAPATSRSS